jgi:histidyl-tRNA synthetase
VYSYYMDTFYPKDSPDIKGIWLFWWDVIWVSDPIISIQNLYIVIDILDKIWFSDYKIKYNYIWTQKEQEKFKQIISDFLADKLNILSEENKQRYEKWDFFWILRNAWEDEKILLSKLPDISKSYKKDSKKDAPKALEYLEILWLNVEKENLLLWDYDFCNWVIWQIEDFKWDVIAKWYSYDELSNLLWTQKEIPATWFWVKVFDLIEDLKEKKLKIRNKDKLDLFFVQLGDDAKKVVLPLTIEARKAWIKTAVSLWTPSMKEQMLKAQRSKASYIVMVWMMEAKTWVFQFRNSATWKQKEIKRDELIDYIKKKIGEENLDFFNPSIDLLENRSSF